MMRLPDKVMLVTGSTTGIGEATARRFVAEGRGWWCMGSSGAGRSRGAGLGPGGGVAHR